MLIAINSLSVIFLIQTEALLLTRTHLALIRAALQYFDEEMSPNGFEVMRPYFEEPPVTEFADGEIRTLRERIRNCTLAYVRYDPATMRLTTMEPCLDLEDIHKSTTQHAEIATILYLAQ